MTNAEKALRHAALADPKLPRLDPGVTTTQSVWVPSVMRDRLLSMVEKGWEA